MAAAHARDVDTGGGRLWELSGEGDAIAGSSLSLQAKTQPAGAGARTPQAKQLTGLGQAHPSARRLPKDFLGPAAASRRTSRCAPRHGPAHQRPKIQLRPPVGRHRPFRTGNLHKPLDTTSPTKGQTPDTRKPQSPEQARPYPGTSWSPTLPIACQCKLQDTPDRIPNCVTNHHSPLSPLAICHQLWDPQALPPDSRTQLCLPVVRH